MLTAGIAAGLLLIFLLPTFNALNNSYVQNVKPPPWVTPPSQYPDVTPPDMTPPTDFPTPTNIPSNLPPPKDGRIPPGVGGCPNPTITWFNDTADASAPNGFSKSMPFRLTNRTVYLEGYVNVTSWSAPSVSASLSGPAGFETVSWTQQGSNGGLFPANNPPVSWHYQSYNNQTGGKVPPAGAYTVRANEGNPAFGGHVEITFGALVCGGAAR